jgi:hypothetical protein
MTALFIASVGVLLYVFIGYPMLSALGASPPMGLSRPLTLPHSHDSPTLRTGQHLKGRNDSQTSRTATRTGIGATI